MKKFKNLALVCAVMLSATAFVSCGDDNDEPSGSASGPAMGSSSVTIDGTNYKISNAYYAFAHSDGECELMFTDFNMMNVPWPAKVTMFNVAVPSNGREIPTGVWNVSGYGDNSNAFNLTFLRGNLMTGESYDFYYEESPDCGQLSIEYKSGKYYIAISNMELEGEVGSSTGLVNSIVKGSFSYVGTFEKMPGSFE